jgi:hypothetical protein
VFSAHFVVFAMHAVLDLLGVPDLQEAWFMGSWRNGVDFFSPYSINREIQVILRHTTLEWLSGYSDTTGRSLLEVLCQIGILVPICD